MDKVGITLVSQHPKAKILYYISVTNKYSGYKKTFGWLNDENAVREMLQLTKDDNYDINLHRTLIEENEMDFTLIDDEVIDSFVLEEVEE